MNSSNCFRLHSFFKSISNSFLSLFVPIIIFINIGYKQAIIYLALHSFINVICLFLLKNIIKKHTLMSICLHIIFSVTEYIIIMTCKLNITIVIVIALVGGISNTLYYASIHSIVSANNKKTGFSIYQIWQYVGNIVVILFNGYILNLNNSFSVFIISLTSLFFFVISVIPLFLMRDNIKQIGQKNNEPFIKLIYKTRKFNLFNMVFGIQCFITEKLIPVYLVIKHINIEQVAIIVALINLIKIMVNILITSMYKKNKSFILILIGSIVFAITCIIIPVATNNMIIYIATLICGFIFPIFYIPSCNEYEKVIKNFETDGMVIREISVHLFRPLILIPFIFIEDLSYVIYFGVIIAVLLIVTSSFIFKNENSY